MKTGDVVMIVRSPGELPVECTIKSVFKAGSDRPERVYYTDGCLYCRNGGTHRLGMGGSRLS